SMVPCGPGTYSISIVPEPSGSSRASTVKHPARSSSPSARTPRERARIPWAAGMTGARIRRPIAGCQGAPDRRADGRVCAVVAAPPCWAWGDRLRSGVLRKLALAAASTAFALVLLEGVLRVSGLELHDRVNDNRKYGALLVIDEERGYYRHPANASVRLQGVTLRFNSLGMRDDEPRVPKPPDVFRILCLGDSMALGPAVAQDAIYPARLRALLGSPTVDLVTGAAAGWNTVEEEHFLAANI